MIEKIVVIKPIRVFKMGAVRLADPAPNLPPEEAVKLYAASYPHLANVKLDQPVLLGKELHYAIKTHQEVETKG